jgi:type II secretion system (T2SS) protein M
MLQKLSRRDRIALIVGTAATALFLVLNFGVLPASGRFVQSAEAINQKELALRREQRLLANTGLEKTQHSAAQDRVKDLETGLLESASTSLANAEWQRLIRLVAESKGIVLGSSEFLRVESLSPEYSLVTGRVQFRCRLDQLVNFLVAVAASPKALSVKQLTISPLQAGPEERLNVQMIMGAAARALKPDKGIVAH